MKSKLLKKSRPNIRLNVIICTTILGLLSLLSASAQFAWPVYEPFGEYTNAEVTMNTNTMLLQTNAVYLANDTITSSNWNFGNPNKNWLITTQAVISWPGLVGDTNSVPEGIQEIPENTSSADSGAMFTQQAGTIYASFLLNYQDNGGASDNRCIFNIVSNAVAASSDTHFFASVWLTPDYGIVINKNVDGGGAFSAETLNLVTNSPTLIVLRYKAVPGGNDELDMWVNPPGLGNDSLVPPPTLSTTNGPNIPEFNGVILSQRKTPNYQENVFQIDEIRFGSDWAYVTPATPSPGPEFGLTGGGSACPGVQLRVGLNGSVATNEYLLYTNGAYSGESAIGTGSTIDFGLQSTPAVYTVLASNLTTTAVGWLSNSVSLVAIPAPIITAEPNPATSAANSRAEFTVGVVGTGFTYQWYQNGNPISTNANITGAKTNDLVIISVNATNAGNYYCIIGNSCGEFSTTTTNALTLDTPNNLTWSGDVFSLNIWAVGMTQIPEFVDSGSNPQFFNEGDNVTFNDSYNASQFGSTITLSNTMTPGSMTFSMSQFLTWGGPGIISGSGSLLVNGTGKLLVNNNSGGGFANTFTGGTVIDSGTVNMSNSWALLGSGPITLAGGTLETDQKSSGTGSSVGFLTNILVTANSTWQIDKTGNQCAGLGGALLGNVGTTLTITNSATTTSSLNEIRFNGVFTNNSAIVTYENSAATGSSMQIGAFNSSGVQVYNGAISGATAAFFVSGKGSVYLNGANTYINPTFATAGFLAGSGSIAGPLDVSSNATIGAGPINAIGTFSVNNNIIMTNGANVLIRVNKSLAQSNDLISVTGGVITNTGGGTVIITNIGATSLAPGDQFQIFSGAVSNGAAVTVSGGFAFWVNNLAVNGSIQVQSVIPTYPTNINYSVSGGTLTLTWPSTHLGWILQRETNSLSVGLVAASNSWHDVSNSGNVTSTNISISLTNPAVFYRLRHP